MTKLERHMSDLQHNTDADKEKNHHQVFAECLSSALSHCKQGKKVYRLTPPFIYISLFFIPV